MGGKRVILISA
jgi:1-phosphatidylinositol-4-phosphate 5-kinase